MINIKQLRYSIRCNSACKNTTISPDINVSVNSKGERQHYVDGSGGPRAHARLSDVSILSVRRTLLYRARCVGFAVAQCPLLFPCVHCSSRLRCNFIAEESLVSRANENTSIIYQCCTCAKQNISVFLIYFHPIRSQGAPASDFTTLVICIIMQQQTPTPFPNISNSQTAPISRGRQELMKDKRD